MKDFKLFYLKSCPYCKRAMKYLEELREENPLYAQLELEMIEEKEQAALADTFDYYYVPTFYYKDEKLFEGAMKKEDVQKVLQQVVNAQS